MEGIKAFFGFTNTDNAAKLRCRQYLKQAVDYGSTLTPVPDFIANIEKFLATLPEHDDDAVEQDSAVAADGASEDPFWVKWDDFKEDALNLLTARPENANAVPDGNFVTMWQHLENGRLPASTAPSTTHNRRRSSLARVRLV